MPAAAAAAAAPKVGDKRRSRHSMNRRSLEKVRKLSKLVSSLHRDPNMHPEIQKILTTRTRRWYT